MNFSCPLLYHLNTDSQRSQNLYWGVIPIHAEDAGHAHPNKLARRHALKTGLANKGDNVIIVRGFHQDSQMNTPTITMLTL